MPDEEIKVTQEDLFGINATEPWAPDELEEEVLKGDDRGFITSPADIDPREPIKLRDAKVAPSIERHLRPCVLNFRLFSLRIQQTWGKHLC